jgi:hypothetical protein
MIADAFADMPTWKFLLSIPLGALVVWVISSGAIAAFMKKQAVDENQWAKARRAVAARLTISLTVVWTFIVLLARYSNKH